MLHTKNFLTHLRIFTRWVLLRNLKIKRRLTRNLSSVYHGVKKKAMKSNAQVLPRTEANVAQQSLLRRCRSDASCVTAEQKRKRKSPEITPPPAASGPATPQAKRSSSSSSGVDVADAGIAAAPQSGSKRSRKAIEQMQCMRCRKTWDPTVPWHSHDQNNNPKGLICLYCGSGAEAFEHEGIPYKPSGT